MSITDYIGLWILIFVVGGLILAFAINGIYQWLSSEIKKWRGGKRDA